jgi:hypothetical protein
MPQNLQLLEKLWSHYSLFNYFATGHTYRGVNSTPVQMGRNRLARRFRHLLCVRSGQRELSET